MKMSAKDYDIEDTNPVTRYLKKRGKSMKKLIASRSHHFSQGFGTEVKPNNSKRGQFRISRNHSTGSGLKFSSTYHSTSKNSYYSSHNNFSKTQNFNRNYSQVGNSLNMNLKNVGGLAKISQTEMIKFQKDLKKLNKHYILDKKENEKEAERKKEIDKGLKEMEQIDLNIWTERRHKIVLYDGLVKNAEFESQSILRGSIFCRNKFLPMEFKIIGNEAKTEVLIRFNKRPNHKEFDMACYSNKFTLDAMNQSKMVSDYSIKFMIICLNDASVGIRAKFLGMRPKKENLGGRFENIDYNKFLRFKLNISEEKKKQLKMMRMRELPIIKKNKNMAYLCNENYWKLVSKNNVRCFVEKRDRVKKRKEEIYQETKQRKKEKINKFVNIKKRNMFIIKKLLRDGVKIAKKRIWLNLITHLLIVNDINDKYQSERDRIEYEKLRREKAQFIAIHFKTRLDERRKKTLNGKDLIFSKKSLNMVALRQMDTARERAKTYAHVFIKFLYRATSVNWHLFEYVNRFNLLRKKFKKHMICKENARDRMDRYLIKAKEVYFTKIKLGEIKGNLIDIELLTSKAMDQLFFLLFEFQILDFLREKYEKRMANQRSITEEMEVEEKRSSDKLFNLSEVIQFKETRKRLEGHKFYYLYNKINENCKGVSKLEDYIKIFRPSMVSVGSETVTKEESKSTYSVGGNKKFAGKVKRAVFNRSNSKTKVKEGTFQYRMMKKQEEEAKRFKEEMQEKKHTQEIMGKIHKEKYESFRLKVGRTYMFIAITTIIEYFKLNPSEFKELGQEP